MEFDLLLIRQAENRILKSRHGSNGEKAGTFLMHQCQSQSVYTCNKWWTSSRPIINKCVFSSLQFFPWLVRATRVSQVCRRYVFSVTPEILPLLDGLELSFTHSCNWSSPVAAVHTNNNIAAYFKLQRGTRQGCTMSPLLFAVANEPRAVALQEDIHIKRIVRGGQEYEL